MHGAETPLTKLAFMCVFLRRFQPRSLGGVLRLMLLWSDALSALGKRGFLLLLLLELELLEPHDGVELVLRTARGNEESVGRWWWWGEEGGVSVGGSETFSERI